MSFLEWLIAELYNEPPIVSRGGGESTWCCPQCGRDRFHTFPLRPPYKHRAKCWTCGFRGDVVDMLQYFRPVEGETYPRALRRLDKLRRRYDAEIKDAEPYIFRGNGESINDPRDVSAAWNSLRKVLSDQESNQSFALQILRQAAECCERYNVSVESVTKQWQDFNDWVFSSTLEHAKDCTDEDCGDLCRAIRGLPVLNKGEEYREEHAREVAARRERAQRAVRGCKSKGKGVKSKRVSRGRGPKKCGSENKDTTPTSILKHPNKRSLSKHLKSSKAK